MVAYLDLTSVRVLLVNAIGQPSWMKATCKLYSLVLVYMILSLSLLKYVRVVLRRWLLVQALSHWKAVSIERF